jgi:hypothetical protein
MRITFSHIIVSTALVSGCIPIPPDGGGHGPPPAPGTRYGCEETVLLETPEDPAERGPWPVGVRTVTVDLPGEDGDLNVEVFYPAVPGSEAGVPRAIYDIREFLPADQQDLIPDEEAFSEDSYCDCFRDLPIDTAHGPYPGVLHIHGTAAFRVASRSQLTHWASRGFIAFATDHPGMYLGDMLALASLWTCETRGIGQDVDRDVAAMLPAVRDGSGGFSFLSGVYDASRIAIVGHSQGGLIAARLSDAPGVRMVISMAGGRGIEESSTLESVLVIGGMEDALVGWDLQQSCYEDSPSPKRLVGIAGAGHLVVTDLCGASNEDGQDPLEVAQEYGICGTSFAAGLWDCDDSYVSQDLGTEMVNYATTAALEETLHCRDRDAAFAQLRSLFPEIGALEESL